MIRRKHFYPFLSFLFFFFFLLSIPQPIVQELRSVCIAGISPSWEFFSHLKHSFLRAEKKFDKQEEQLKLENQILKNQLTHLENWFFEEKRLSEEKQLLLLLSEKIEEDFFARRLEALREIISRQLQALPAKVIFREPALWGSHLWINVGNYHNKRLGSEIIAKNSPVVVGRNIVGIVEEVKEKHSLVRLITDSSFHPSVRAVRGSEQNRMILEQIESLLKILHFREDLPLKENLEELLIAFKKQLYSEGTSLYLAKGELQGMSEPLWRATTWKLKGLGFNYDFSDQEGASRELRTGALEHQENAVPLIHVGDLLITTGMDGVFPADLHVGIVTKILPLREGGCSYDLEAIPTLTNLHNLTDVFVLPPS